MSFLKRYLRSKRRMIIFAVFCLIFFLVSFALYHLPLLAVIYPAALCMMAGTALLCQDYQKQKKKHELLEQVKMLQAELITELPEAELITEPDYQDIIIRLCEEQRQIKEEDQIRYNDMVDYYTIWAHQIKTPIAAMRLNLQNEDSDLARKVKQDLNRIERYVEMVLTFLRLSSESTDYVIAEYDLDGILRSVLKRFSSEFIGKRLSLSYQEMNCKILTDEKWFCFVVEQILSNAVKYTNPGGKISVYLDEKKNLCFTDNGIGIAAEDLPRIFEKGYTGFNGRMDKKASGIGLYLCKQICDRLGHKITAVSEPGVGTSIKVHVGRYHMKVE